MADENDGIKEKENQRSKRKPGKAAALFQKKENPGRITILETYVSQEAYKSHIASEHFQKYKQGTLHMVKTLVLSDQMPLNPANCINNFIQ